MIAKILFILLCGVSTLALLQHIEIWAMRKELERNNKSKGE